jgi:uncharacterized protein (DUF2249 family)
MDEITDNKGNFYLADGHYITIYADHEPVSTIRYEGTYNWEQLKDTLESFWNKPILITYK